MFKRKSGKDSMWIFVMKWRQTCGTVRWEDGPRHFFIPHPLNENRMRIFQCTAILNYNSAISLNMFEMHLKFKVKYLWETIEVGSQEAGLVFLKTLKENNLQNSCRLL